jgi:hypothetical protein
LQDWRLGGISGRQLVFDDQCVYGYQSNAIVAQGLTSDKKEAVWTFKLSKTSQIKAMLLSGKSLFISEQDTKVTPPTFLVKVLSVADGQITQALKLSEAPAYLGLAVADGRLFLTTQGGKLLCYGSSAP